MRKVLFGLLWFVIFYFAGAMIVGAVVGLNHQQEGHAALQAAAGATVTRLAPALLLVSAALAAMGAYTGFLPGTRGKKAEAPAEPE